MSRHFPILIVTLLIAFSGPAAGQEQKDPHPSRCERLLDSATAVMQIPNEGARAAELFRQAFQVCPDFTELQLEKGIRLANLEGRHLLMREGRFLEAIAHYTEALRWVEEHGDVAVPGREELLKGRAEATERAIFAGDLPETALQGVEDDYREALRTSRKAYGPTSREAIEGRLLLATFYLRERPEQAEIEARAALDVSRRSHGEVSESTISALATLAAALDAQGKVSEAEAVREILYQAIQERTGKAPPPA